MVNDLLRSLITRLKNASLEYPEFEAEQLMSAVYGDDFKFKLLSGKLDREPTPEEGKMLSELANRRIKGEPLQYILGKWEFYGIEFEVGEGVLIPRQDTETLVDKALELLSGLEAPNIIDLCSGTGCIPIAIEKNLKNAKIGAVELYPKAYNYLKRNISLNKSNVTPYNLDVLDVNTARRFAGLDLITCNPPYLTSLDMSELQKEVKYEPDTALFGDDDGLKFYRVIADIWRDSLKEGGVVLFEIGASQGDDAANILKNCGWRDVSVIKDYANKERVVSAVK